MAGAYLGNPELGFALGSLAGSVLFPTQLPAGPQISDNRTTTANLGGPVPIVFGTASVAGQVIWLAPYIQNSSEVGAKGGPQQLQYSYTQSIAIALCESVIVGQNAIAGITRIWENGTIVYDIRPMQDANTQLGLVAETPDEYANRLAASAVYAETFTLYLGTEEQVADPTIEAVQGAGNVPGYRGLAYIVYPNRALTTAQGWRHPNFTFEVYTSGTGQCTSATQYSNDVLYPWATGEGNPVNPSNSMAYKIFALDPNVPNYDTILDTAVDSPDLGSLLAITGTAYGVDTTTFLGYAISSDTGYTFDIGAIGGPQIGAFPNLPDPPYVDLHYNFIVPVLGFHAEQGNPDSPPSLYGTPGGMWWQGGYLTQNTGTSGSIDSAPDRDPPYYITSRWGASGYWYEEIQDVVIRAYRSPSAPRDPCYGLPDSLTVPGYAVRGDGRLVQCTSWVQDTTHNYYVLQQWYQGPTGGNSITSVTLYPLNPCVPESGADALNETFWTNAYNEAVANGQMPAGMTYSAGGGAGHYPQLQNYGWTLDLTVCEGSGEGASVASIVTALCARAGLTSIDVSDLASTSVDGYAISALTTAKDAIAPLRSVCFFDAVESGPLLRFQTRGKDIVATLTTDDIGAYDGGSAGAQVPPSLTIVRTQDIDLPRRIRLHYLAISRDYQPGEQDSPFRLTTTAVNDIDVNVPIVLGDTQALQCAEVLWADAWSRNSYTLSVDQSWSALEGGDCIAVPVNGVLQRIRIVNDKNSSGVLRQLSCVLDDNGAYISYAIAQPPLVKPPTLTFLAQTNIDMLDIPCLQDSDNDAGFYIAAQRDPTTGNGWKGAQIYKSTDGGATFVAMFSLVTEATLGTLPDAVPASPTDTWDDDTTILVNVASSAFTFESRTDAAVIAGANAAAMGADGRWEIIQFANAVALSATQWQLSRLLRGRRGTEHVCGTSQPGDSFVMVSTGDLNRIVLSTAEIGSLWTYKAVSIGLAYGSGRDTPFAGHAEALVPFSPVDLEAVEQTNGDILLSWIRRGRLGRTLMSGTDIPLSEETESYSVDILSGTVPIRTVAAAIQHMTYTAAQQAADFPDSIPLTELTVAVYQLSAVVGRGTPALATLAVQGSIVTPTPHTSSIVVTFGGTFQSGDDVTVLVTYAPRSGAPSAYALALVGAGKSAVVDYATDLTTQATTALAGKASVSRSGDVVTIASTTGSFTASAFTNNPIANVALIRAASASTSSVNSIFYVDLYTEFGLAPATSASYLIGGLQNVTFVVHAYDEEIESALSLLQLPPIPSGLQFGDVHGSGFSVPITYTVPTISESYFDSLYNLAAQLNASTALAPYFVGASAGQLTGTPDGTMSRPAISIQMKPGYFLAMNDTSALSGYSLQLNVLQNGNAYYPSGAAQRSSVAFTDEFNGSTYPGTYYSTLAPGQEYFITLAGTTFTHTVASSEMADPVVPDPFAGSPIYYRDAIYADLKSQIEATTDYACTLSLYYRAPGGPDTWCYRMVIESTAADTPFTCVAGIVYDLTVSMAVTP